MCLCAGSVSAERMGQGEVSGFTCRMLCTWQALGLGIKGPWLAPGGQILALVVQMDLENAILNL